MCRCWLQQRKKFRRRYSFSLHKLPFYRDDRPEAKERRKKWVNFVRLRRAKWEPSQSSVLCTEHFKWEDFVRSADLGDVKYHDTSKRWMKTADLGVNVFPSVHAKALVPNTNQMPIQSDLKEWSGRLWYEDEHRRDRHSQPIDERPRYQERRDERRFRGNWGRERWRR